MAEGIPILPNHPSNPAGQTARIRRANRVTTKQLRAVKKWLSKKFLRIPFERIVTNQVRYEYEISATELSRVSAEIETRMVLEGNNQVIVNQAISAYEDGTGQSVTNLLNISDDYTRSITKVLRSSAYQKRVALASSRVFEEMKGFDVATSKRLGSVLAQAIDDGVNPLQIVNKLSAEFGISKARAKRIARTEITGALRRARWDEARDAQENLSIRLKMMHLSALSPTTRETHSERHGSLFTVKETREFYAVDANGINCKCSQVEVLTNKDGSPKTPKLVDKVRDQAP